MKTLRNLGLAALFAGSTLAGCASDKIRFRSVEHRGYPQISPTSPVERLVDLDSSTRKRIYKEAEGLIKAVLKRGIKDERGFCVSMPGNDVNVFVNQKDRTFNSNRDYELMLEPSSGDWVFYDLGDEVLRFYGRYHKHPRTKEIENYELSLKTLTERLRD